MIILFLRRRPYGLNNSIIMVSYTKNRRRDMSISKLEKPLDGKQSDTSAWWEIIYFIITYQFGYLGGPQH